MTDSTPKPAFDLSQIAKLPPPGFAAPHHISFTHDDALVTYLYGTPENPAQQLYGFDSASGQTRVIATPPNGGTREESLSLEEELRRQRERTLAIGITDYSRAQRSERLLIPISGGLYVQDAPDAPLRQVVDTTGQAPALSPKLSPDGAWVAYVQDSEIYVVNADETNATPQQITQGARGTGKTHGLAEYIAQEEFGRADGFWWSSDGMAMAYTEVDERHIPVYRIMHQGKDAVGDAAQEDHRYAFAGADNALVRLGVMQRDAAGAWSETVWLDMDFGEEVYLLRVFWWQDGQVGAEVLNRRQDTLWLVKFDGQTGARHTMLTETSDVWVNTRNRQRHLLKDGRFVWGSERDGYNHLYLYAADGTLIHALTSGEWMVDALNGVDEERGIVYFTGNQADPLQAHFYAVSLEGGPMQQITEEEGKHSIVLNKDCTRYVDYHQSLTQPPRITLHQIEDGAVLHTIHESDDPRIEQFNLTPPEMVTLKSRDGVTLYGALYRPLHGEPPYPTIVYVYGGPGPQVVSNEWRSTGNLRLQHLRQQGFLVFALDNRGSARRGLAFEGAIKHRMGTVEVDDQVDGVRWLIEQGLTDAARVGIFGWSYGGYMTLMSLLKAPDVFKVGVAGAPVTHWDGYDTGYTERYMDTPQNNPTGYHEGSVMAHVDKLTGKLLIIHGMLDENVHFRHTARLINALNRADKDYDLLIFPDERHMPRRPEDRTRLERKLAQYFIDHL